MLIKSEQKDGPANCKLFYICNRCGGKHYFYGSATPDNLEVCRLCLQIGDRDWLNRIHGSSCHILAGNQGSLIDHRKVRNKKAELEVTRNNPKAFKRR